MRHTAERWQMRALMGGTGPDNQTVPDAERQLCDYGRAHKTP